MSLLAVVDRSSNLRVSSFLVDGLQFRLDVRDARWPSWLSAHQLAYSSRDDSVAAVVIRDVERPASDAVSIYRNEGDVDAVLGPGTPHYVLPAPDGNRIAVVAPGPENLALSVIEVAGGNRLVRLPGAPIFSAWSGDSRYLAVHASSDLFVVDCEAERVRTVVRSDAVGFRTPAVGPSGELAYVGRSGRILNVGWARIDGSGWAPGPVTEGGAVGFFRPATSELWLGTRPIGSTGLLSRLGVTSPGLTSIRSVYRGPFTAFTWSPSGRTLVLAVPRQPGDDRTALVVLDEEGTVRAESETFFPSDDQRTLWSFFDQYCHSHSSWLVANGEEYFVVAGRPGTDRVSPSFGGSTGNRIMVWRPRRWERFTDLGPGEIAVAAPPVL